MPRLSVCLIVRNEERHLARCLESVRGLADDIVVLDTGSTDRTIEIAHAHGARVHHFTWQDDFSLAKNASIEQATGDWILSIDADETIAGRDHAVIRAAIAQDAMHAYLVPQRNYLAGSTTVVGWQSGDGGYQEGEPYPGYLDVDCRRLFQNRPWLRFRNRVHEELVSMDPARPLVEARGAWVLHHFGKLGDHALLRAKGEAYLRIGRKKVEDEPQNPQAHYELGVQYAELDQPETAIASYRRGLELSPRYRDAEFRIALCYVRLKQYEDALSALRACAATLPKHAAEIALAEGNVHRELGDATAAERAFRRALAKAPGFVPASINLALLCRRQGRQAAALTCLEAAVRLAPTDARLQRLRARILTQERRFAEARDCLFALGDSADAEIAALRGGIALGLGELDEAVTQLRRSLDIDPTDEAALNLSIALEARGEQRGALEAAAQALRVVPSSPVALARFAKLSRRNVRLKAEATFTIFFYQPHSIPFDGTTPRTRGLGGTESAIVYLAEALARLGHRCVIFNTCDQPAAVEGVEYAPWQAMPVRSVADEPDVVVSVRHWQAIGKARFAPLQIFWTGDAFDQPFLQEFGDPSRRSEIDLVMLQSDWQIETFHTHHGLPLSQIVRTTLGAAASAHPAGVRPHESIRVRGSDPRPTRPRRMAYASTPFRGLDVLLDLFPRIRGRCPDAELEVFSSMRVYGMSEAEDQKTFEALYRKADQPGVTLVGSVPQLELAARLRHARILAYPNHYAETFCIAAAEAQAAGCPVVTTALGALTETVGEAGICIPGDPRTPQYQHAFVDACVSLLTDDERWQGLSGRAVAQASAKYSWMGIAAHWETVCRAALAVEPPELDRIAVHLAAGRAGLAQRMLARTEKPGDVPPDAWAALETFTAWRAGEKQEAPALDALALVALSFKSLRKAGVLDVIRN